MGNRGGRLHRSDQSLGAKRWSSKAWIACKTHFRGRRREVMGDGYTELFFLDEATALAAGHRPCYECRRADARAFASAWAAGVGLAEPPRAPEIDARLHLERVDRTTTKRAAQSEANKPIVEARIEDLPPGAMIMLWGEIWLVAPDHLLRWSFRGYDHALTRFDGPARLLTPPSVVAALAGGYCPHVESALF